jgi:hypothetical protein
MAVLATMGEARMRLHSALVKSALLAIDSRRGENVIKSPGVTGGVVLPTNKKQRPLRVGGLTSLSFPALRLAEADPNTTPILVMNSTPARAL